MTGSDVGDGPSEDLRAEPLTRILPREELLRRHARPREVTLVFTNGCFDLLHRGHVAYLNEARSLGDLLVVGLNSDASVRRLKGGGRPVMGASDRAYLLASLRSVDAVTIFEEDTPRALIEELVPDVLVKGADYRERTVVGRGVVEEAGGEVRLLALEPGHSTSGLMERIRRGENA